MLHQRSQHHSHCLLAAVRPACLQCRQGPGEHRAYGGAGATGDYGARSAWLPRAGPGLGLRPVAFISLQVLVSSVKGTKSQSSWQGVFLKCLGSGVHAGQPGCVFCLLCWLRTPVGPGPPVVPAGPRPGCFTASIRGSVQGTEHPSPSPCPRPPGSDSRAGLESALLRGVQVTPRGPGEEGPGGLAGSRVENRGQWGQGPLDIPDPNALFWDAQTAADKSSCPTRRGVWSMARLLVDCPPLIRMLILKGDKQRGPSLPPWPRSQR